MPWRVGITTGCFFFSGVGKSTTIDTLGSKLTAQGKRPWAVLGVDPSSNTHRRLDPR